jgi:2-polyprenyl-3-methyl-5-hydroxy-6-metoxy-1,4-benzoquinol methylase
MKTLNDSIDRFDQLFQSRGVKAQRTYPNEAMIQFIALNWFSLGFEQRKSIRILEVGCGSGANLWMLAKEGFSVFGLDSSEAGLAIARDHLQGKWGVEANLECGSVTALSYEAGFFDAVIDVVTLQHLNLRDSESALSEIRRVLKPDGLFFSYRISDCSSAFLNSGGKFVDAVTVDNIANTEMPLNNSGPISFWGGALARKMYLEQGFIIESLDRVSRSYGNGKTCVEYLAISAKKDKQ